MNIDAKVSKNEYNCPIRQDDLVSMYKASLNQSLIELDLIDEYFSSGREDRNWLFQDMIQDLIEITTNPECIEWIDQITMFVYGRKCDNYINTIKKRITKEMIAFAGGDRLL